MAAMTQLRPAAVNKCGMALRTPPLVGRPTCLLRQAGSRSVLQSAPGLRPMAAPARAAESDEQIVVELPSSSAELEPHREKQPQKQPNILKRMVGSAMRVAAVMGVATALALGNVDPAAAASSGGRVGGSAGFSRGAASRSYGGSYGGSSRSSMSSRGSYSAPRSTAVPRSSGVYHTTTVLTAPSVGIGMPVVTPYSGYGYGMSYGAPVYVDPGFSLFRSMLVVMMTMALAAVAMNVMRGSVGGRSRTLSFSTDDDRVGVQPVTVAKVQVALLANARGLKRQLDELGASANTSTSEGLHLMMQEAVLALLRYPEYCVSAAANSTTVRGSEDNSRAESVFQAWSLEERSRIKQETLVNTGGRPVRTSRLAKGSSEVSELIVVTLLVAAEGQLKMPSIRTPADLRTALSRLGAVSPNALMAAEITWTPQADNDSLTQHEVLGQYPDLVPL